MRQCSLNTQQLFLLRWRNGSASDFYGTTVYLKVVGSIPTWSCLLPFPFHPPFVSNLFVLRFFGLPRIGLAPSGFSRLPEASPLRAEVYTSCSGIKGLSRSKSHPTFDFHSTRSARFRTSKAALRYLKAASNPSSTSPRHPENPLTSAQSVSQALPPLLKLRSTSEKLS